MIRLSKLKTPPTKKTPSTSCLDRTKFLITVLCSSAIWWTQVPRLWIAMESAPGIFLIFIFSCHMAMIIECLVAFSCYQHWEYKLIDHLSQCFFQILPIAMYFFCLCIFSTDLQQRTEDRENTNHAFRPFHITGESCYCWTHSKQSDYHFTNPKKKLTTEIFFFFPWLEAMSEFPQESSWGESQNGHVFTVQY